MWAEQTEKELYEARLKLIDLEMTNKKQEQAIAESAGHICRLQDEATNAAGQRRDYQQKGISAFQQLCRCAKCSLKGWNLLQGL